MAARLAEGLMPGMVVAVQGDLGAGKTTFAQGLARALGIHRPVTSPTFALCHEYATARFTLFHMDLFRLTGPDDLESVGFPECIEAGGVAVIEWPERAGEMIPSDALHVRLSLAEEPGERWIEVARQPPRPISPP